MMINPALNIPSAVVSPRPAWPWKKTDLCPLGVILTMVVPVPWRLPLSLKLETRMSPGSSGPPSRKPSGTCYAVRIHVSISRDRRYHSENARGQILEDRLLKFTIPVGGHRKDKRR
jgi:hypothetical protein